MGLPQFFSSEVIDYYVRENFARLSSFFKIESPLLGFKHFEISIEKTTAGIKFPHNLGFIPQDLISTFVSGGVVTWNYSRFDATNLNLDVTVSTAGTPCVIRFFVGRYISNP